MTAKQQLGAFLRSEFPQTKCIIEELGSRSATVRHPVGLNELRPGGSVSGPVLMETADVSIYVAILNEIGMTPLAVTTNLNINFLRKPSPDRDIIGVCSLIKLGKRLVVGEVTLYSEEDKEPVAHVVGTYSIPPRKS
jgi:uncharacterized protein (TIGR00369 family)